jgi:hypothetical protein
MLSEERSDESKDLRLFLLTTDYWQLTSGLRVPHPSQKKLARQGGTRLAQDVTGIPNERRFCARWGG